MNIESLRETIIQIYLFDGYPAALEGLLLLKEYIPSDSSPPPAETLNSHTLQRWIARGEAACRLIYREKYSRLVNNINSLSPDLGKWMITEGYGKVLSRPGLELPVRELINVAVLSVKFYPRQLYSHLLGCLHTGVPPEKIPEMLEAIESFAPENTAAAKELWRKLQNKP
ncbi:MAG: hypothetical protein H8E87_06220 [FCB group bacterium]|nr:hypothetical protein [FCB group bacterium]